MRFNDKNNKTVDVISWFFVVKHGANKSLFNISLENDYNQHLCSLFIVSVIFSVFMSGLKYPPSEISYQVIFTNRLKKERQLKPYLQ